jgi:hypothetical protein
VNATHDSDLPREWSREKQREATDSIRRRTMTEKIGPVRPVAIGLPPDAKYFKAEEKHTLGTLTARSSPTLTPSDRSARGR